MPADWNPQANSIFLEALGQPAPQREPFLERACGENAALAEQVRSLLAASDQAGSFLESPSTVVANLADTARETAVERAELSFLSPSERPDALGRLGHYEVLAVVGSGGFGIVLKAFDQQLHRIVAIKALNPTLAASATARKRFVREARAAAAINHENVVNIHGVEESGPVPYLIMEYVGGVALEDRLKENGPPGLKEILRIGMQIAAGLAAAHKQGLVHRDVKPANILLENGVERVKITDFGLARTVDDATLTQTGVIAGTPQYMSPEQARGEAVDHRSDLFSLGSVLYAMCAGRAPFRGATSLSVLRQVCDESPHPLCDLNAEIPECLVEIIGKLHAKAPAERYQSAGEVAELLGKHLAQLQNPRPPHSDPKFVPHSALRTPHSAFGRRWVIPACGLVCLLAALGLAEATGTTQLAATVIRILTPEGTLVVEVDDPEVQVTIEGDGGIIITGGGLQQVRLKPGSYKVQAAKDGKPVPLDQELVTIARGGKQVVRVRLEGEAAAPKIAAQGELGAFVLLGGDDLAERKFDTLAEAIQAANNGDTIEVRGNGPFVSNGETIDRSLVIRAGEGFRPSIILSETSADSNISLLNIGASLVLEGLELQRIGRAPQNGGNRTCRLFQVRRDGTLRVANCRLVFHADGRGSIVTSSAAILTLRNCELLTSAVSAVDSYAPARGSALVENCVISGGSVGFVFRDETQRDVSLHLRDNSFAGDCLRISFHVKPKLSDEMETPPPVRVDFSGNVTRSSLRERGLLFVYQHQLEQPYLLADVESQIGRLIDLDERQNVFQTGARMLRWGVDFNLVDGEGELAGWDRFWKSPNSVPLEGDVLFQGGDLFKRTNAAPEQLAATDFRLLPDSAGYRAGSDGKDLGADIDLVGPGAAYERWKKTPGYQQWLEETGQARTDAAPKIDCVRQANEHAAGGRLDQAADAFNKALSLIADPNAYGTARLQIVDQFVSSDELFQRVVKLRPKDVNLWSHRAHHLAEVGRWEESIVCYQKRLDLGPDGAGLWQIYSLALLSHNDEAANRNLCEKMLAAFANHTDPMELAQAALAMAVVPDSVQDKQRAFRLAERAANDNREDVWFINLTYAAWLYRLDRLEEAIVWLDKGKEEDYQGFSLCFLAMAHHRLGHADEAQRHADAVRLKKSEWTKATTWYMRVRVERLIVEMDSVLAAKSDKAHTP